MEIGRMDYENVCRTCLSSTYQLEPIFESCFKNVFLNEILMLLAPISISPMDGLSDKICSLCKSKATSSYEFQLLCTTSEHSAKATMMNHDEPQINSVKLEINHLDDTSYNDAYADFSEFEKVLVERVGPVLNSFFTNEVDFQPNICETCDQFFESAEVLKQHSLECVTSVDLYPEMKPKEVRKHKCEICEKLFESPSKLARHSTVHVKSTSELDLSIISNISTSVKSEIPNYESPTLKFPAKHRCQICGKMAQSPSKLLRHMNTHNKVKATSSRSSQNLTPIHQEEFVKMEVTIEAFDESCDDNVKLPKEKRYKCDICGSRQESPSKLMRHMGTHNKQKTVTTQNDSSIPLVEFPCAECSQKFFKQCALDRHQVVHSTLMQQSKLTRDPNEMFICVVCSKQYSDYDELLTHMRNDHKSNNDKQDYVCVLCEKSFNTLFNIMRHAKTHEENATHGCAKCGKKYGMGNDLIDHILRHENYKPFSCKFCDKSFLKQYKLKNHMSIHQEHGQKKLFLCPECGREFTEQYYLKRHQLRHSGVKKYSCHLCPSKFTFQNGLTSHMSTHTGEKPHLCSMCNASFAKAKSLKSHERLHTGVRPYACNQCGKRFNESGHLTRHLRTHTGEKPYQCTYCERSYAQSNDLVKHTRTHVGANYYKCQICGEAFRLQGELKLHIPTHFTQGAVAGTAPVPELQSV